MDNEEKISYFKTRCQQYLSMCSLGDLRCYGRTLNLPYPTRLKKEILIQEIIRCICGEEIYQRNNRGAPIKNHYFPHEIKDTLNALKKEIFGSPAEVEEKTTESSPAKESVRLQLSVAVDQLTEEQKQLLKHFLGSL